MDVLSRQLFGRPWAELDLEALETFVSGAGEEGVSWHALAGALEAEELRRHVCAFANSERGGYVLIGVEASAGGGWSLSGLPLADKGARLWVDAAIDAAVRPRPDF